MARDLRFEFGKNWQSFLKLVDEERIQVAAESLRKLLNVENLQGKTFLDIGCGSGLFSLAATRLGAKVHSFDIDEQSVACALRLQQEFASGEQWTIDVGSILDESFINRLPTFDVVYSWGVLHHTGKMWQAIENAAGMVSDGGRLSLAIYNDQGGASRRWRMIKKLYNASPRMLQWLLIAAIAVDHEIKAFLSRLLRFQNPLPFQDWAQRKRDRGMSLWHDIVDWVGGYPFEVAAPDAVFNDLHSKGFTLDYLKTQLCGYGCNEYTFRRESSKLLFPNAHDQASLV